VLILLVTAVPVAMSAMFTVSMARVSRQLAANNNPIDLAFCSLVINDRMKGKVTP